MPLEELIVKASEYLTPDGVEAIKKAYEFAAEAHGLQTRRSGGPFVEHPVQTAMTVADLRLDAEAIQAALLHDVPEDCGIPLKVIEERFGHGVGVLVDGVTKLSRLAWHERGSAAKSKRTDEIDSQAENLRKMFIAMAEDIRVVLIKLADRLHNMRTLSFMPDARRKAIAEETMEIFAPLASRLGIWQLKWELEDLSFHYLDPERYKEIAKLIASRRTSRESYIEKVVTVLQDELGLAGIAADISGRPKHIYSIHKKMEKYASQGKNFDQIYDLLAVRVLVDDLQDCYSALGVVHSLWHPIPGQFDDYIANPKESMYQSLHTTVVCLGGKPLEIQIRSREMHRLAEYGIAAHWRYKEGAKKDVKFDEKIAWLRQLIEWQKDLSGAREFVESIKTDMFRDQVFVYTPRGEIKDLPAGSTPLDFAYRIHTDLGHRCVGGKVNGRLVHLDYQLQNGDIVEIISSKQSKGPSRDWLNPNLGYVRTSHSKEKIRQWFRKQERGDNVERGKELLEKEFKRLALSLAKEEEIARIFKFDKLDDFHAAIGCGEINTAQIATRLAAQEDRHTLPEALPRGNISSSAVEVLGIGDLLTHLAQCCSPLPGDPIVGYITRSRGVTIHRADCLNVVNEDEKERLIKVDWGRSTAQLYPVMVRMEAVDRVGLLRDVTTIVSEQKVNMAAVSTQSRSDRTATITMTIETTGIEQLSKVLAKIEGVRGIVSVARA
ncbi:MAG: bifunctional (p)ppGpp synthetase/guanosine-3',5'-bis(diphosphate) 3'-pyrophosphohydrolase [Dehalococcoidia bacterium]|nr:bifunctional (p)ppGpp synthetase/guanosine-3',5'-bis(diphosphate) 3'-pyrophosphohydrolase [Dehalococcoidia bacterium]